MNQSSPPKHPAAVIRWWCALLAMLLLPVTAPAQPTGPQRWLLVFDLSAAMKPRLPATEEVLKNFFATSARGRLQAGDYIGVWTYDQKLHTGQFPLITWNPMQASVVRTNLAAFLGSQKFTGKSRLAALQPGLGEVVVGSERLTVIIFCDGESDIHATPYDRGINQNFLDGRAERRKSQQPFVVLIRTLSGKSVGCTVNYPPGAINIPLFLPPPPVTNPPPAAPIAAPVKPPPVVIPDLIMVGTNLSTATTPSPKTPPPTTNPVPVELPNITVGPVTNPAASLTATNPVHSAAVTAPILEPSPSKPAEPASPIPAKTNLAVLSNLITAAVPPATHPVTVTFPAIKPEVPSAAIATNALATTAEGGMEPRTRLLFFAGIGLLAAAIGVVVLVAFRPGRRPRSSLISSSMDNDPRRK